MKRKLAALISFTLVCVMVLSMAGCGGSAEKTGADAQNSASQASGDEKNDDLEPITFTMYCGDPSATWNEMKDDVGRAITEKTGVTLEVEFAVGDPQQKEALTAASGEYPDFMQAKYPNLLVDANAFVDLTDLIEENAPNIKEVYGDYFVRQRWNLEDPSIYVIASIETVNQQYFDATGGFELQLAVLKDQNYPSIRTVKDFENAIKAYKDKYPKIDGKETIGLSLIAEDWRSMITVRNPAFLATGAPDDGEWYIDPKTYEAKQHYLRPEEKEYFRWLNHVNSIGLLDKETFTQKYDQYKAKIATGTVLGLIDQEWQYKDGEDALKKEGKYDRTYAHFPVTLTEGIKDHSFQSTGFSGGLGTSITKSCKDPERAIKFLDFLASEEGQILNNWGIKDKHYTVDENGTRHMTPEAQDRKINDNTNFTRESGISQYRMSIRYGDGVKDSTGNYYTTNFPEQVVKDYTDAEREVLSKYNATTWLDLFPKASEFEVKEWGAAWQIQIPVDSDLHELNQRFDDIAKKRIPETILCEPSKFDQVYDSFLDELRKAGADKAGVEYSKLVKDKIKLWTE